MQVLGTLGGEEREKCAEKYFKNSLRFPKLIKHINLYMPDTQWNPNYINTNIK